MQLKLQQVFAKLEEYAARFGANFVIAFSGGGDSMALLEIAIEWQKERKKSGVDCKVKACIIDHGIAANSAEVAQTANLRAAKIGVEAKIIRLNERIENNIQETARRLRYEKLGQFAESEDAKIILLAHNQDDQIETILFRMLRATALDGLAGMRELQSAAFANNIILGRPLLDASRQELRDFLNERGLEFYDDPANQNLNFSRVKIRDRITGLRKAGFDFEKILKVGNVAAQLREKLDHLVSDYLKLNLLAANDKVTLQDFYSNRYPEIILKRAIGILIQSLGTNPYRSPDAKLESLYFKITANEFNAATLAGVKIKKEKSRLQLSIAKARRGQKNLSQIGFDEIGSRINSHLWHNRFDV